MTILIGLRKDDIKCMKQLLKKYKSIILKTNQVKLINRYYGCVMKLKQWEIP